MRAAFLKITIPASNYTLGVWQKIATSDKFARRDDDWRIYARFCFKKIKNSRDARTHKKENFQPHGLFGIIQPPPHSPPTIFYVYKKNCNDTYFGCGSNYNIQMMIKMKSLTFAAKMFLFGFHSMKIVTLVFQFNWYINIISQTYGGFRKRYIYVYKKHN